MIFLQPSVRRTSDMSFTYSVNTDGTVSNVQFEKTEVWGYNVTCAEDILDDLDAQNGQMAYLQEVALEELMDEQWDELHSFQSDD